MKSKASLKKATLKDVQRKEYLFFEFNSLEMFDDLITRQLKNLPKMKSQTEVGQIDDPNYCTYHCLIGHPTKK